MISVLNSTVLTLKQHVFSAKLEKPVQTHAFSLFEQTVSVYPVQTDDLARHSCPVTLARVVGQGRCVRARVICKENMCKSAVTHFLGSALRVTIPTHRLRETGHGSLSAVGQQPAVAAHSGGTVVNAATITGEDNK